MIGKRYYLSSDQSVNKELRIGKHLIYRLEAGAIVGEISAFVVLKSETVAPTSGSITRRIVPKLHHLYWLLKMNNQLN